MRTLGEFFRLRHALRGAATVDALVPYVTGAAIAALFCWLSVTLYFFRRHFAVIALTAVLVIALLVYKSMAIGW